jgi:hypothetical protein
MPFQDDVTKCNGLLRSSLPFFLVMIGSWWPEPNLDTYSLRMHFFSFVPETEDDTPDIGIGRKGAYDWCCAGGSVAFLFDGATEAAEVVGGIVLVGCLIDCLGFDIFLMTKELCSLLLSPCSNEVSFGREGHIT